MNAASLNASIDIERLVAGLPARISQIPTDRARRNPQATALIEGVRTWSNVEFARAVSDAATSLHALGVRGGDRVMVVTENSAIEVVLLFAIATLDAWAVLVNARMSPRELDQIRKHACPRRVIFVDRSSPDTAAHAKRERTTRLNIVAFDDAAVSAIDHVCEPETVHASNAEQVAALVYTSGTTGAPKGVMLTHRNLLFVATVSATLRKLGDSDRVYGVLPFSHVYGLASVLLGTMVSGSALLTESRFTPEAMADAIEARGATIVQGVPAMYAKLLAYIHDRGRPLDRNRLRFVYAGGSPLDLSLKFRVESALGLVLHNGYGLTETSPTVAQTRIDAPRDDVSVGQLLPGVQMRLVDLASENDATAGTPGELWIRGPNVMKGYYRDAAQTSAVLRGGEWLVTGDLARIDARDDALFIVGRTRELIIRSGFNVFPVEVEGVLNAHPAVLQSAVVGRAVEGNEEVVAFVELRAGVQVEVAALRTYAAERLAPYKRPAEIVFMSPLPASSTGKILKHQLAQTSERKPSHHKETP